MQTESVSLTLHEKYIVYALRDVRLARTQYTHSPNAETERWVQRAEAYLDEQLDRRPRDPV